MLQRSRRGRRAAGLLVGGLVAVGLGSDVAGCSSAPQTVRCTVDADCAAPGTACLAGACQAAATLAITSPGNGAAVNRPVDVQVAVGGWAAPEIELLLDDATLARVPRPYVYTWNNTASADGTYVFKARLSVAGQVVESAAVRVVVDRKPPPAPTVSSIPASTTVPTVAVSGTAEPGATVTAYLGTVAAGSATANATGAWDLTVVLPSPGAHALSATATDAAGNTSAPSVASSVQLVEQSCQAGVTACASADVLSVCRPDGSGADFTQCALGCTPAGPRCLALVPTAPVAAADLAMVGLAAVTIPAGEARFNTDTGEITGVISRGRNEVFTRAEVSGGIGYRQAPGLGIFAFAALRIPAGATVKLIGTNAAALVATTNESIEGVVEARPMSTDGVICPVGTGIAGPGGGKGGSPGQIGPALVGSTAGEGPGAGGGTSVAWQGNPGGGGGAGHGAGGGAGVAPCHLQGGTGDCGLNANGGAAYGSAEAPAGGSGGGGGAGAKGGGGGGAVRIVAGATVTIGDGVSAGGVNAGGCGGGGGAGAGGGGSGGSILVEAPVVQLTGSGVLAANGGGGGGQDFGSSVPPVYVDGASGALGAGASYGAGSYVYGTSAGNGGAGDAPAGTAAYQGAFGRGGGGAAGRIHLRARDGAPTLNAAAVISPSLASGTASVGAATAR